MKYKKNEVVYKKKKPANIIKNLYNHTKKTQ